MELKNRSCPVCGSGISTSANFSVREFQTSPAPRVVKCYCGMVYLNPLMTDAEYKKFYDNDEQRKFAASVTGETQVQYQSKVSKDDFRRVKMLNEYIFPNTRLLDIGSGLSGFVGLIDGAVGIDVSESRVRGAQAQNLNVKLCDIFDWNEEVDMVTLFHVLEHITEPHEFLRKVHSILATGGRLVIEVPNIDDALVGLDLYKAFYFQNAHCSYFNPQTLRGLLNRTGFVVSKEIRLQRYSIDNHLHWLLKSKPGKFAHISFLNEVYAWFLKVLKKHDTIFLVCNKE